jgi:hypothetical protein
MPGRVVLHVGTHKTGTTSIQQFLRDENDRLLAGVDASYAEGFLLRIVHTELPLLVLRPERMWPARLRFPETQRLSWQTAAGAHVRGQVSAPTPAQLVYLHEDLSYLRYADEFARLRALLDGREVTVVVFLREREAFLRSYAAQLEGTGFEQSDDPTSFAYVRPDSWIADYDALLEGYRGCFGAANVKTFDYDAVVARDGTVIPTFAELLGIPRSSLPPLDDYFLNPTGAHIRLPPEMLGAIRERLARLYP